MHNINKERWGGNTGKSIVEVTAKKIKPDTDASGAQSECKNSGQLQTGLDSILWPPIGSCHLPKSPPQPSWIKPFFLKYIMLKTLKKNAEPINMPRSNKIILNLAIYIGLGRCRRWNCQSWYMPQQGTILFLLIRDSKPACPPAFKGWHRHGGSGYWCRGQ